MRLTVMFFGSLAGPDGYDAVLRIARGADRLGFAAVWLPERHFHPFGGLFPNPAVLGAAVAVVTERVQIRAGSVVAPLHDSLRIAEEWAVVDNLSSGRVALSLGSGWNAVDFVLATDCYDERVAITERAVGELRALWRGQPQRRNGPRAEHDILTYPRPVQAELPLWLTASGNPGTFARAGRLGANVLTHLLGQDLSQLAGKIDHYRAERAAAGHESRGTVTLMLHTYVARDDAQARRTVRPALLNYLRTSLSLEVEAAATGRVSRGRIQSAVVPDDIAEGLLADQFEYLYRRAGLLGSAERCTQMLARAQAAGVDEVACLVDFGLPVSCVLDSMALLADLATPSGGIPGG